MTVAPLPQAPAPARPNLRAVLADRRVKIGAALAAVGVVVVIGLRHKNAAKSTTGTTTPSTGTDPNLLDPSLYNQILSALDRNASTEANIATLLAANTGGPPVVPAAPAAPANQWASVAPAYQPAGPAPARATQITAPIPSAGVAPARRVR